jgi:hypothetical protein
MTISNNPKLKVKLDKANELEFLLSIKGTSSDPMAVQPVVKFHLKEEKSEFGLVFPMERVDGEKVKVTIPGTLPYFAEGKNYTGIVEVNLGNRLFMPTTVDIIFERELEVIALPILEKEEPKPEEPKLQLEEIVPEKQGKTSLSLLDVIFPEDKPVQQIAKPAAPNVQTKPKPAGKKNVSTKEQQIREKLKAKFKSMLID